jgi:probable HAF family extracellular repeat protein
VSLLVLWLHSRPRTRYQVVFLPDVNGFSFSPSEINDQGQIVGHVQMNAQWTSLFLWDPNQGMRDLGTCVDFRYFERPRINNAGQIAWAISDPNADNYVCLVDPDGTRHVCHPPDGEEIHLNDLNNRGQIVGYLRANGKPRRAFVWSKATGMQDVPIPDAAETMATGINDMGQIVGSRCASLPGPWSVFLWDPNAGVQDLGSTGSRPTYACRINNQGFIVARFEECALSIRTREKAWRRLCPAANASIQIEGLDEASRFVALTDREQLVILELDRRTVLRSYLWAPEDGFTEISRCLELTDTIDFLFVRGINNRGQIAGMLKLKNQPNPVGVLLQPISQQQGR